MRIAPCLFILFVPLAVCTCPPATFAAVPADDVMIKVELEDYGAGSGLSPVQLDGAAHGKAMALASDAMAAGGLNLPPGDYTLLLRTFAPAGDQDGFFVEIDGTRTRRVAPIGRWGVLAFPFSVKTQRQVTLTVLGQEAGIVVDRLAVVRGTFADEAVDFADIPDKTPPGESVGLADLVRLRAPARLRELPQEPFTFNRETLFLENFATLPGGVTGECAIVPGKWDQALYLGVPDGRFEVPAAEFALGQQGTIEWWVRPRPAQRLWHDQGWHYFLHAAPAAAGGLQLDLSRHPATQLRLTVAAGEAVETLEVNTNAADLEEWHHILVSWDLTGDRQHLWLLFDGVGECSFFPRSFEQAAFSSLQFANTPRDSGLPWLFMDGAIDEIRVSSVSVAERLEE